MANDVTQKMHQEIIAEFKRLDVAKTGHFNLSSYLGTQNKLYHLKSAQENAIAKEFLSRHKDITKGQFLDLLNALYAGQSSNERTFGTRLLAYKKVYKPVFTSQRIFDWLGGLSGWCEVDSLCQCSFTAQGLLGDWDNWSRIVDSMSQDANISRRQASLVLLTKSVLPQFVIKEVSNKLEFGTKTIKRV
ncbi:hypothetical protein COT50_00965 [candidate division WWE3 bacterium CG08_land_8_20_14_0_20_41_10]|uniref:DNA alkylation repair protein n=1 Tax=candidate division WWE3 bacterium CG08_land_8_20_14_0_20_41_10 TaxID=1975085 RepID=A0A2H0XCF3_UNCKA|nr:MAG: hypothetical protein COT50_00965 [candidate division WWE3 bacterium CG08_land_8_20_14_0_20_41_10]